LPVTPSIHTSALARRMALNLSANRRADLAALLNCDGAYSSYATLRPATS
jgi:hypothetical protein